jgi:hypothetical protein
MYIRETETLHSLLALTAAETLQRRYTDLQSECLSWLLHKGRMKKEKRIKSQKKREQVRKKEGSERKRKHKGREKERIVVLRV